MKDYCQPVSLRASTEKEILFQNPEYPASIQPSKRTKFQYRGFTSLVAKLLVVVGALSMTPAYAQNVSSTTLPQDGIPIPPAVVARDAEGNVTVRAVRISKELVVDGHLDEQVYQEVESITGFIQQLPDEGEPASEKTEVWLLFNDQNIYVSARCWDSQPDRIVANERTRDGRATFRNDAFVVLFDTFHDRRNGMGFMTNPLGVVVDYLITDENEFNRDWNTVWDVQTSRFDEGWTVEMIIPFKSLRFRTEGKQVWGIQINRRSPRTNEYAYLSPVPRSLDRRGIMHVSSAATLFGLETPSGIKNLEVKPYAISGFLTDHDVSPPRVNDFQGDLGIDIKYGITRGLTADFTVNTDFAQVEDDAQQVNLTRFSLFYPEKREFFLEGKDIFAFGGPIRQWRYQKPDSTPVIFFSRRIGLSDGKVVPIKAGGRLTGRTGKYSIGLLNIQTGRTDITESSPTNFSVVRIKRDLFRRSNIGMIYTHRNPLGDDEQINEVYGADVNLAFYETVSFNTYYAESRKPDLNSSNSSYRGRFEYRGDRYGVEMEHLTVDKNFNPEIGFVRREDFRRNYGQFRFSPRPHSIQWLRRLLYEAALDYTTDTQGKLETRNAEVRFGIELENSDKWKIEYSNKFEGLKEDFEITDGTVIPIGDYSFADMVTEYEFGPQRRVSGRLRLTKGSFFSGERTEVSYDGRVVISPRLSLEPRLSVNRVDLPDQRFFTKLAGNRTTLTLTTRMALAALVQYNSSTNSLNTNVRFRWEYQPSSDLFVVYTDGRDTTRYGPHTARFGFPRLQNRALVVKFTKLFRF